VSGLMGSADINAEGVTHALQLAGDALRLSTAPPEQLTAAAAFLAKAMAKLPDTRTKDARRAEGVARLEVAGKAIGAEMRRRAFGLSHCSGDTAP
jgi:hypothetical protein